MVLEAFYEAANLRKNPILALPLGFLYTCIGIGLAFIIFPGDAGLASVAFASILMLPSLTNLVASAEASERRGRKLSMFILLRDNLPMIKIYLNMFLGAFFAYITFSLLLTGSIVPVVFASQFGLAVHAGGVYLSMVTFSEILVNNLLILLLCFFISFLIGNGAIFFITWNASVWGVFFGNMAASAAAFGDQSPLTLIITILAVVIIFVVIEALAYIMAAVSGSVLSRATLTEFKRKELTVYHKYATVMGVVSSRLSRKLLKEKWYAEAFSRIAMVNIVLLAFAILALIVGAAIEMLILENVEIYEDIIFLSMGII